MRMKRAISVAVCATTAALVFGSATGAGASTPFTALGHVAGYTAAASAAPTQTVVTQFVVPTESCSGVPSTGFQGVVLGAALEVTGGNTGGGVALICAPTPSYLAFIEVDGGSVTPTVTVLPGDTVSVTVSESAAAASVTIVDGSSNQTAPGAGGTVTSDEVGSIAVNCKPNGKCSPVPMLTTVANFSATTFNGMDLGTAGATRENLADAAGAVEIKSSKLKSNGTAFKDTWLFSCGNTAARC